MRAWGMTDTGLVRAENQDSYAAELVSGYYTAVVCDGMGGTNGGRVASSIAVSLFQRRMKEELHLDMKSADIRQAMLHSVALANIAIRNAAQSDPQLEKMGTTLVGVVCMPERASVCNIGDSRAYHITQGGIRQITRDHSVVENMLENGQITLAEAKHHPSRNLITRALGPDPEAKADVFEVEWRKGDYLLLCTDGLVNTVSDQEILFEVIHSGDVDGCLERLLDIAKTNGAPDNVTAVLLEN